MGDQLDVAVRYSHEVFIGDRNWSQLVPDPLEINYRMRLGFSGILRVQKLNDKGQITQFSLEVNDFLEYDQLDEEDSPPEIDDDSKTRVFARLCG